MERGKGWRAITDKTRCGRVSGTAERTTHVPRNTHPRSEPRPEHGMPPPKRAATAPFLHRVRPPRLRNTFVSNVWTPPHSPHETIPPPPFSPSSTSASKWKLRGTMYDILWSAVKVAVDECGCVGCVCACKDRVPRAVWGGVRTGGLRDAVEGVGEKGVRESECWQVHHCASSECVSVPCPFLTLLAICF